MRNVYGYSPQPRSRKHGQNLIKGRQYESNSDWSEAQPSAEEENRSVDENGWEAFAKWHLAYDTEASEETKSRYKLPFGDFRELHRSASSLPNNAPVPKTTTMSKAPPTDRPRNTLAKTTSGFLAKGQPAR